MFYMVLVEPFTDTPQILQNSLQFFNNLEHINFFSKKFCQANQRW